MPLEFFWGSAVCLDLSEVRFADPDPEGTGWADTEVIQRAEERLAAAGEQIRPGDIVLCWFDYGDRTYPDQAYTDRYPGMSYDGAEYLAISTGETLRLDQLVAVGKSKVADF